MSIFPVMGTALINCVKVDKRSPSGTLVTIDKSNANRVLPTYQYRETDRGLLSFNWLRGEHKLVSEISEDAGLENPTEPERIELLKKYICENELPIPWCEGSCLYQDIALVRPT